MHVRRKYLNPPIVKARCTMFFNVGSVAWTAPAISTLYDRLRQDYDGLPRLELIGSYTTDDVTEASTLDEPPERLRAAFPTDDLSRAVIAAPSALTIQVQKPYEGWESYSLRISKAITSWVAAMGDCDVSGIRMSYDNHIVLPVTVAELNRYFNVQVNPMSDVTAQLWKGLNSFAVSTDDGFLVDVNLTSYSDLTSGLSTSFLNINAADLGRNALRISDCFSKIQDAKSHVSNMFENIITDEARVHFVENQRARRAGTE